MARRKSAATGEPVTTNKVEMALVLLRAGHSVTEAAAAIGCAMPTLSKILNQEIPDEYDAAKEAAKLALADRGRKLAWSLAEDGNSAAFKKVAEAYVPEFKETQRVEVTGDGGGPVQIESKGVSLHALIRFAEDNGIRADLGRPRETLSAARALLPEPGDDLDSAGDVPAAGQP